MKLIIPKIDFEKVVYELDSELNNVDYNVEILEESNIDDNLFYLAGHSGNGDNCYFNRIRELNIGDLIYIVIDDVRLIYKVSDKYYIVKDGNMEVDEEFDTLYLITCDIYNNNRQRIVKGYLIN